MIRSDNMCLSVFVCLLSWRTSWVTGILQSRCQFRNIVWFVRDLSHVFAFEGEGGGGGINMYIFVNLSFFFLSVLSKKNGLKRVIYRQVSVQICKIFPLPPPTMGASRRYTMPANPSAKYLHPPLIYKA